MLAPLHPYWTSCALLVCRMMCFCPKHTPAGAAARQQQVWRTANAAAASTGSNVHQAAAAAAARPQAAGDSCAAVRVAANGFPVGHGALSHQPGPAAAQRGCAREDPYNHALRRGQREPDAIAAALAKRHFVQVLNDCVFHDWSAEHDLKAVHVDHSLRRQPQLIALTALCMLAELACRAWRALWGPGLLHRDGMHSALPSLVLMAASLGHPCLSPPPLLQATPYIVAALGRGGARCQPQSWCHRSAPELLRSAAARPRGGPMHQVLTQTERFLQVSGWH